MSKVAAAAATTTEAEDGFQEPKFQNKSHAGALLYVYIFRHVFLLLIHLSITNQYEDCQRLNPRHHPCYF